MDPVALKNSRKSRRVYIDREIAAIDQGIADNNQPEVEASLFKLEIKELALLKIHADIEASVSPGEVEAEVDAHEQYHATILDAKIRANRYFKQQSAIAAAAATTTHAVTSRTYATSGSQLTAKLPKLQIPKFDGQIADFERFIAQFNSGVHNNATLSKVDKFNYLISLLTEKARLVIKGLALTDSNYDIALRIIQEKYGKPELLASEHINQLWHSRKVTQLGNGQELRLLYEEFNGHVNSLETLGKDTAAMGPVLCHILRQNLPKSLLIEWNRKTVGSATANDNLSLLLDFVKNELEGVEAACRVVAEKEKPKEQASKKETYSTANRTASTLVATGTSSPSSQRPATSGQFPKVPYCYFCDETNTHFSGTCPVYTTNKARKETLEKAKRCFKCFRKGHRSRFCDQAIFCRVCSRKHHTLLCEQREGSTPHTSQGNASSRQGITNRSRETTTAATANCDTHTEQQTLIASSSSTHTKNSKQVSVLQTIRAWIRTGKTAQQVTLLIDGGAERSFILDSTAKRLGLKPHSVAQTTIRSFGGNKLQQETALVDFTLEGYNGHQVQITALQVPTICQDVRLWESGHIEGYLQDKRICTWNQKMGPGELVNIDVLIGNDFYWLIITGHMKRLSARLMATQSVFGWMLQGSADSHTPIKPIVSMCAIQEQPKVEEPTVQQNLKQLWELDHAGIMEQEDKSPLKLQDVEVLKHFNDTITFQDGRYQVRVPWKETKSDLQPNFEVAKERLRKMLWRLSKDPALYQRYRDGVFEYLKNGHSEVVSLTEHNSTLFYMPHHAIIKEDRTTTKVRIVFDGSSSEGGHESLNSCQETGPSLNPPIFNLLLRFRWEAVAMVADIEKAFLQIFIHPDDRDALRFIWTDKPWNKGQEPELQVFRMNRVLFGMKSSPFLLAATIRFHASTHPDSTPELSTYIDERIYVDDLLSGQSDTQTAYKLFEDIHQLFLKGGMKLTKWVTNDASLRQQWVQQGITSEATTIELLKVLGLLWNPATDNFSVKSSAILEKASKDPNTKRSVLSILASIFDPLGFLTPITITIKKMLQDLWKLKIEWDQELPEAYLAGWMAWKEELKHLDELQVPRWLQTTSQEKYQLHIFCDAGPRVYATVCYIRFLTEEGSWHTQLLTSKSRLAPISVISIPRLELLACLIGSRLAVSIQKTYTSIKFDVQFWSDSNVALSWIADVPSRWKLFVGRRVQEIQANTPADSRWSYCPSQCNIADLMTRGQQLSKLVGNQEWWQGPYWLRLSEEEWQISPADRTETDEAELQKEECREVQTHLVTFMNPLIPEGQYSTWRKLIRVTAWIRRFVKNCRRANKYKQAFLTASEIKSAEHYWLHYIQERQFANELQTLRKKQDISKQSDIFTFQPYLDKKEFLRLGGRLRFAELTEEEKHPILLRSGGLVNLLIDDRHRKTLHGGPQVTLATLRTEFWILRGKQSVRKVIHTCRVCRRWVAKPAGEVEAPLPVNRVKQAIPFQNCGIDFAGPLTIKDGTSKGKAYICLFTCAITRAVHLELVASQSLQHFLLAFRRFFARRGGCKSVYSDNGATYLQTDKLLRESYGYLAHAKTQEEAAKFGIVWNFISPKASWWGGYYERMVQNIKYHLRRSLGTSLLNFEELSTLLAEIEAVINNRPLCPLTEDPEDGEVLTPAHFLLGKTADNLCDSFEYIHEASVKAQFYKRWRYKKTLMNKFWQSWKRDYLLQLKTVHQVRATTSKQEPVKLGDIVLIMQDKLPRGQWRIAKVVDLTSGRDDKVRSVMLQLPNNTLLRRAVQHVCPLEVV